MPQHWRDDERRRLLLAIIDALASTHKIPWSIVKAHMGARYSELALRKQYSTIRRALPAAILSPQKPKLPTTTTTTATTTTATTTSKHTFPAGIDDDDEDVKPKPEQQRMCIKVESVDANGVVDINDDNELYQIPAGPRPPSPLPLPPGRSGRNGFVVLH